MVLKEVICVLFVFFALGSVKSCTGEAYSNWTASAVAGTVIGTISVFAMTISIIVCLSCSCCPLYRYRSTRNVIQVAPLQVQQPFVLSSQTNATQHLQRYPAPANLYNPPLPGHSQAPPPNAGSCQPGIPPLKPKLAFWNLRSRSPKQPVRHQIDQIFGRMNLRSARTVVFQTVWNKWTDQILCFIVLTRLCGMRISL